MGSERSAVSRSQNRLRERAVSSVEHLLGSGGAACLLHAARPLGYALSQCGRGSWVRDPHVLQNTQPCPTDERTPTILEAACRRQWPSFVPAKTPLGQPLGQISDLLSVTYAICPRISQKKDQTTFSILNSPFFRSLWRRLAADNSVFCPSQDVRGTALGTNK